MYIARTPNVSANFPDLLDALDWLWRLADYKARIYIVGGEKWQSVADIIDDAILDAKAGTPREIIINTVEGTWEVYHVNSHS
jgi:hypothetical protein